MAVKKRVALAVTSISALVLAGCANTAGGSGGAGETVAPNAPKEDYIAALADIDPIELNVQTLGPKGSTDDAKDEKYYESITEWSGGKVTFNVNYAQAVASGAQIDSAVSSGLLDIATVIPSYNPDKYPTFQEITLLSGVLNDDPAASLLQAQGWWASVPAALPSFDEEFDKQGLKVLVPGYVSAPHSMQCTEPRRSQSELAGAVMRSSEPKVNDLLKSVGASASNIPTAEAFEALQRGIVDCEVTSMRVSAKSGTLETAHFVTTAPIGYNAATVAANKDVWEELSPAVQQLFLERLDVYYTENLRSGWKASVQALDIVHSGGGNVEEAAPSVVDAFDSVHAQLRANASPEDVEAATELAEKWSTTVAELGFEAVAWEDFADWYETAAPSPEEFVKVLMTDLREERQP